MAQADIHIKIDGKKIEAVIATDELTEYIDMRMRLDGFEMVNNGLLGEDGKWYTMYVKKHE